MLDDPITPEGQVTDPTGTPAGGEGAETPPADYAGFSTPEELVEHYKNLEEEHTNLKSVYGRQGNELGTLRQETARLSGMLEAIQNSQSMTKSQQASVTDIQRQLDDGDITSSQAFAMFENVMSTKFEKLVDEKVKEFQGSITTEQKINQWLNERQGKKEEYINAFNSGALQADMDMGFSAQHAFDRYEMRQENERLKKQLEQKTKEAEQRGLEKGLQLKDGDRGTSKVFRSPNSGLSGITPSSELTARNRNQMALAALNRMRSSSA